MIKRTKCANGGRQDEGFTLVELVAIVAVVAVIGTLVLPAFAVTKSKAQGIQCMNNMQQMMRAINLYSSDFAGFLPPNPDDGNTTPGHNWCPGQAGLGGAQQFNPDILDDPNLSMLARYGINHLQFKCPADSARVGTYQGTNSNLIGTQVPSARTISMNGAVGTDPYAQSNGKRSVNGPWLDNNHANTRSGPYQLYGNVSDFSKPGPAQVFVFIDEDYRSLNDGALSTGVRIPEWIDLPGSYHNRGAGVAFADGHAEIHPWIDPRTIARGTSFSRTTVPGSVDWQWLADRTTVLK